LQTAFSKNSHSKKNKGEIKGKKGQTVTTERVSLKNTKRGGKKKGGDSAHDRGEVVTFSYFYFRAQGERVPKKKRTEKKH